MVVALIFIAAVVVLVAAYVVFDGVRERRRNSKIEYSWFYPEPPHEFVERKPGDPYTYPSKEHTR